MRFTKSMTTIVLISSCVLSGCSMETKEDAVKPSAEVASVKPTKGQNEVEEILIKEPSVDADTPGKASVEQIQLTYKNGQTAVPTNDDILSEAFLGQKAIVTLQSPEGPHHYIVLFYEQSDCWILTGVLPATGPVTTERSESRGLKLPFSTFTTNEMSWSDAEDAPITWTFAGKESILTVSKLPQQPMDSKPTEVMTLANGIEAYVHETKREASLSYQDGEHTVLITGNVSVDRLKILAASLPSVTSGSFPYGGTE